MDQDFFPIRLSKVKDVYEHFQKKTKLLKGNDGGKIKALNPETLH